MALLGVFRQTKVKLPNGWVTPQNWRGSMSANSNLKNNEQKVKILSAFLADPDLDHNVTEIARLAGVSRNTVYRHLDDLKNIEVIIKTRESGGSPRYQLNKDNPAAKKLAELEWELMELAFED